jgi:hypothetical protein
LAAFGLTAVWNFAHLFSAQTIGTRRSVKGVAVFEGKTSRDVGVESVPEMLKKKSKQNQNKDSLRWFKLRHL